MEVYGPGVDVVVVNYKTPRDLEKFIASYVFQQEVEPNVATELVVVDVDADEYDIETAAQLFQKYDVQGYQYWPMTGNCGYSGACNFASTVTNREVVAFFNADTQLSGNVLYECYQELMSDPRCGVVGPMQVNSANKITHAGIFGSNRKPKMASWMKQPSQSDKQVREAVSVSGSAYFVKREAWDDCHSDQRFQALFPGIEGAFLPTPHYYEETFFSYFARHKGWKVIYKGDVSMIHEWHRSSPVNGVAEREYMPASRMLFRRTCSALGIDHD